MEEWWRQWLIWSARIRVYQRRQWTGSHGSGINLNPSQNRKFFLLLFRFPLFCFQTLFGYSSHFPLFDYSLYPIGLNSFFIPFFLTLSQFSPSLSHTLSLYIFLSVNFFSQFLLFPLFVLSLLSVSATEMYLLFCHWLCHLHSAIDLQTASFDINKWLINNVMESLVVRKRAFCSLFNGGKQLSMFCLCRNFGMFRICHADIMGTTSCCILFAFTLVVRWSAQSGGNFLFWTPSFLWNQPTASLHSISPNTSVNQPHVKNSTVVNTHKVFIFFRLWRHSHSDKQASDFKDATSPQLRSWAGSHYHAVSDWPLRISELTSVPPCHSLRTGSA